MHSLTKVISSRRLRQYLLPGGILAAFLVMGVYLFRHSMSWKAFSDVLLIRDLIWLDAWGLLAVLALVAVWRLPGRWSIKAPVLIGILAVHGAIVVSLILDGTAFGINGYWGDQKFRIAMILKFMNWWVPVDFYQNDLPPFYPPVYYLLLSTYARIFSLEAYQMIKIGTQYIYLLGPFIVYYVWSRVVSRYQALCITLASFLFLSSGKPFPFLAPHAFVGDILFIPWWLHYVEQVKRAPDNWRHYVIGGLLGGIIFMTYYFGFFVGALLIGLRLTVLPRWKLLRDVDTFRFKPAAIVLALAAICSAPFWLPLLIAMITHGSDPGQQRWHHIESVGIQFKFLTATLPGLLYLGSIYYAARRFHAPIYRGALLFLGSLLLFYLIGATLGALDRPLNLIKANELMIYMAGPIIGLAAAALTRAAAKNRKWGRAILTVAVLFVVFFVHQFNTVAKQPGVKTARTSHVPSWDLDADEMTRRAGSVFLCAYEEFPSFYPVYTFVAANHHYTNPCAQYNQRYQFLSLLQGIHEPYLLNTALRHNVFDRVEYLLPRFEDGALTFPMVLDNYPDRYSLQKLTFPRTAVDAPDLFPVQETDRLLRVTQPGLGYDDARYDFAGLDSRDSLILMARVYMLERVLNSDGCGRMDRYLGTDWSGWETIHGQDQARFADSVLLLDACRAEVGDSLHLFLIVRAKQDFKTNYKVFVHLGGSDPQVFLNCDFLPIPRVDRWKKEGVVLLHRAIPNRAEFRRVHLGFYNGGRRLGSGWWFDLP